MGKRKRPIGQCPLCGESKPLAQSHIVPSFVFRTMKKLGSGYLVGTRDPDGSPQDGPKPYLLCDECEGIGSKVETLFHNELYAPLLKDEERRVPYGPWLKRFIVFTTFKSLVNAWHSGELAFPGMEQHLPAVQEAIDIFRSYLLGQRADAGPYTHYISIFPKVMTFDDDLPTQAIRALAGAYSEVLITEKDEDEPATCYHYILMQQVVIWTYLTPHEMPFPQWYVEQGHPLPDQVEEDGVLHLNTPQLVGLHSGIAARLDEEVKKFQEKERKPQTIERLHRRVQNLPDHFPNSAAARFGQLADQEERRRGKSEPED